MAFFSTGIVFGIMLLVSVWTGGPAELRSAGIGWGTLFVIIGTVGAAVIYLRDRRVGDQTHENSAMWSITGRIVPESAEHRELFRLLCLPLVGLGAIVLALLFGVVLTYGIGPVFQR